jgi:hypothetical protein
MRSIQNFCSEPFIPVDVRRLEKPGKHKGTEEGGLAQQELAAEL